ncbi:MAG: SMC family ATPase, partial [Actinomycetota bacterium]|nr:SMC family ATPase [Actinomycetota bacterium]
MLLNRIYLRNFRVYEDELDLELPPGLVGIYGPNGSGKSTLLEAIVFALWGKARTAKDEIRSSGVGGDCVAEVSFEHEGHLFVVRRTLSGINSAVRAEAHADGLVMATGVRETGRYIHSVLGMDDIAFRASVFAEQKQLAAFSTQSPAERRRLVLQLLGITPLDAARDAARRDARDAGEQHRRLRDLLPDVDVLTVAAADADAQAAAAEATAETEEAAVEVHRARAEDAAADLAAAETGKAAYDALVGDGHAARAELERVTATVTELADEETALAQAADRLVDAEGRAEGLDSWEARCDALSAMLDVTRAVEAIRLPPEPSPPERTTHDGALDEAGAARDALASIRGQA